MIKYRFFKNESNFAEQAESCIKFFKELYELLNEDYEVIGCGRNPWDYFVQCTDKGIFRLNDHYLIPNGTKNQITYYGKPYWSFRISDHWNWYEDTRKCKNKNYIQCFNVDLPRVRKRFVGDEFRSCGCSAIQVAIFGNHDDEAYHCVYGAYRNKENHEWMWMEKTPQEVIEEWYLI